MFPFFVITKLFVETNTHKENFLDKFFAKTYNSPTSAFSVFFMSCLAGYPMGAKLICAYHEQGKISPKQAKRMMSFCSVSGPMFMIGTVGVGIFKSFKAGIIILVANIIAALINGLFHRGKFETEKIEYSGHKKEVFLADIVYDSLISILMVGGFIIISFLLIDTLININVLPFISGTISSVFFNKVSPEIVQSVLSGLIEITRGIIDINNLNLSLQTKIVIASGSIGFGGISIMLQSMAFLKKINMKFSHMLFQKTTQGIISTLISIILVFLVF